MSKTTCKDTYRGYTINNGRRDKTDKLSCNTKTLDQIIDTIEYMTGKHSRVLSIRLDIQNYTNGKKVLISKDITRAIENTIRSFDAKMKAAKNDPDLKVVWTAEKASEHNNPHFHLNFVANGNAIQNGYSVKETVSKYVKRILNTDGDGLVNFSGSNGAVGKMIERDSPDFKKQMNDAVYAASYLAKTRSKEFNPKGSRVSSASRIKKIKG